MLCLETSQVCTSLFYLHWNVRKILLVSFISLHERLLLFQLGIIRKNCKYNCLSHLIKKKKKGGAKWKSSPGNTNLSHRQSKTWLAGTVQLRFLWLQWPQWVKTEQTNLLLFTRLTSSLPCNKDLFSLPFPNLLLLACYWSDTFCNRDLSAGRLERQTWSQAQLHCCVSHCFTQTLGCWLQCLKPPKQPSMSQPPP